MKNGVFGIRIGVLFLELPVVTCMSHCKGYQYGMLAGLKYLE